jgi:integrase
MASLQSEHGRGCPRFHWTRFDREAQEGCTCQRGPMHYVIVREGKKVHREKVGRNRQQAERALRRVAVQVDDGAYQPQRRITFEAWGEIWLERRRAGGVKANSCDGYQGTLNVAGALLGHRQMRTIGVDDVHQLLTQMRTNGLSDSTRAKHLRVLHGVFQSAMKAGYAARNPVALLDQGERPSPGRPQARYFEDAELSAITAALDHGVYRVLVTLAIRTGCRLGELLALEWRDFDSTTATLNVERSWTHSRLSTPKNGKGRPLDLDPDTVTLLGEWWGECGRPDDKRIILPGPTSTGYLNQRVIARELRDAMVRADVSPEGADGVKRTFHSLRHSHARIALERGLSIVWLQQRLGHSSITVTVDRYGKWASEARKREARKLVGAFPA